MHDYRCLDTDNLNAIELSNEQWVYLWVGSANGSKPYIMMYTQISNLSNTFYEDEIFEYLPPHKFFARFSNQIYSLFVITRVWAHKRGASSQNKVSNLIY